MTEQQYADLIELLGRLVDAVEKSAPEPSGRPDRKPVPSAGGRMVQVITETIEDLVEPSALKSKNKK